MNKNRLSAAMLALLAAGASAPVLLDQFLDEKEGSRYYTAYPDAGSVWTICRGLTRINGQPVTRGLQLTEQQCDHYNRLERDAVLTWIDKNVTVPLNEAQRAGIASFCVYNLGAARCRRSTFWRKLSAGDFPAACAQIQRWVHDGGRDCRTTQGQKNGCYGQVIRRDQEAALICRGLEQ